MEVVRDGGGGRAALMAIVVAGWLVEGAGCFDGWEHWFGEHVVGPFR